MNIDTILSLELQEELNKRFKSKYRVKFNFKDLIVYSITKKIGRWKRFRIRIFLQDYFDEHIPMTLFDLHFKEGFESWLFQD